MTINPEETRTIQEKIKELKIKFQKQSLELEENSAINSQLYNKKQTDKFRALDLELRNNAFKATVRQLMRLNLLPHDFSENYKAIINKNTEKINKGNILDKNLDEPLFENSENFQEINNGRRL